MCRCEDRPCCGCDQEVSRYDHEPDYDYERERLEMSWYDEEDEEDETETETSPIHEDQDFLTD